MTQNWKLEWKQRSFASVFKSYHPMCLGLPQYGSNLKALCLWRKTIYQHEIFLQDFSHCYVGNNKRCALLVFDIIWKPPVVVKFQMMRNLRTQYEKDEILKSQWFRNWRYLPTNLKVVPIIEFSEGQHKSRKDKTNTRSPSRTSNVGRQWQCWAILC